MTCRNRWGPGSQPMELRPESERDTLMLPSQLDDAGSNAVCLGRP